MSLLNFILLLNKNTTEDPKKGGGGGGKKKGGSNQTISATHRDQLNKLMITLKNTHPHFVRCIIPNELKTPALVDAHLVLHQLHCNGVLEGIRICRKGFPNRMMYAEFKQRYSILAPNAIPKGFVDAVKATGNILKDINLPEDNFRMGSTKVFFRAGILGQLEELRDVAVSKIIAMLQAQIRAFVVKKNFKRMLDQKLALGVLQRNTKKYLSLRNWSWWKLYTKVKPLLSVANNAAEQKEKEEEAAKVKETLEKEAKLRKEMEEQNVKLLQEKNDLFAQLEAERSNNSSVEDRVQKLVIQKSELESQLKELEQRLSQEEGNAGDLEKQRRKLEGEIADLKKEIDDFKAKLSKSEADNKHKDGQIHQLQDDMARQDETIAKLTKEKKRVEELNQKTLETVQQEEDKVNHLNKVKAKLEQTLNEVSLKLISYVKITYLTLFY